jgi:hypothetical protein
MNFYHLIDILEPVSHHRQLLESDGMVQSFDLVILYDGRISQDSFVRVLCLDLFDD